MVGWLAHKSLPAIRSGLNQACSAISKEDWAQMTSHTNIAEILHELSYHWTGRYVTLLTCVKGYGVILNCFRIDSEFFLLITLQKRKA
jgi:hypothetical protein